jgi:hypothetical protein
LKYEFLRNIKKMRNECLFPIVGATGEVKDEAAARLEAGDEAVASSKAGDEEMVCSRARIEDGKWWWRGSVWGDIRA